MSCELDFFCKRVRVSCDPTKCLSVQRGEGEGCCLSVSKPGFLLAIVYPLPLECCFHVHRMVGVLVVTGLSLSPFVCVYTETGTIQAHTYTQTHFTGWMVVGSVSLPYRVEIPILSLLNSLSNSTIDCYRIYPKGPGPPYRHTNPLFVTLWFCVVVFLFSRGLSLLWVCPCVPLSSLPVMSIGGRGRALPTTVPQFQ